MSTLSELRKAARDLRIANLRSIAAELYWNSFCPTGEGGGVDPTCSSGGTSPINKEFYSKQGATEDEIHLMSKLLRQQTALKKKEKAGRLTDEDRSDLNAVGLRLDTIRKGIKARKSAGGKADSEFEVVKDTSPKKAKVKTPTTKEEDLERLSGGSMTREEALDHIRSQKDLPAYIPVQRHGMAESADMKTVKVEGVHVFYEEGLESQVSYAIRESGGVHPELWKQSNEIVFTRQKNENDKYWEEKYGIPGFEAHATGGDGSIVAYGGSGITGDTIAHECAHNLAYNIFKTTSPSSDILPGVSFQDRKMVEGSIKVANAVTNYGKVSIAEDFAEFAAAYNSVVHNGKKFYHQPPYPTLGDLKQDRPDTFRAIQILLGDHKK